MHLNIKMKIKMKIFKQVMSWVIPIVVAVAVALTLKSFVIQPMNVSGPSMEPSLTDKEPMLIFKLAPIHRGSVVTFDAYGVDPTVYSKRIYVKRVIGVPGDTVKSKDGVIYVNGKAVDQSYISKKQRTSGTGNWDLKSLSKKNVWLKYQGVSKVPENYYFVLGDNRSVSKDSRYIGFVPRQNIIGVAKVPPIFSGKNAAQRDVVNVEWKSFWSAK